MWAMAYSSVHIVPDSRLGSGMRKPCHRQDRHADPMATCVFEFVILTHSGLLMRGKRRRWVDSRTIAQFGMQIGQGKRRGKKNRKNKNQFKKRRIDVDLVQGCRDTGVTMSSGSRGQPCRSSLTLQLR